jgi:uncharacterized protein (DUF1015 family)
LPLIQPFRALRPASGRAAEILAPPYDVLSSAEARERAKGKPWSFLHVSKPEIDLDPAIDPYDPAVYAKADENLRRMIAAGVLLRDDAPRYYVYRLTWRGRAQSGIAAVASVAAYDGNRIRKHELTTPVKEDDRVRQIEAMSAETGPVMLAYPAAPEIDALLTNISAGAPEVDVIADDGVRHQSWVVYDDGPSRRITEAFDALPALYIADGHHRAAAASRIARARGGAGPAAYFLAVAFPHHQMTILDYNRVLKDLNGHTPETMVAALGESFAVAPSPSAVKPAGPREFGFLVRGHWFWLSIRPELVPQNDLIGRLPISLLSRYALEPLFGIADQRRDKRIDFVGGARGLAELERRVASGEMAAAFALYPTSMEDLMAVADAAKIMPPKSTWFEPKLADGMVSHVLD